MNQIEQQFLTSDQLAEKIWVKAQQLLLIGDVKIVDQKIL